MKNYLSLCMLFALSGIGRVHGAPTQSPTESPAPSPSPSDSPTQHPTKTLAPTTTAPSASPTRTPSASPTESPAPSPAPSSVPSASPSSSPSAAPTPLASSAPSPSLISHVASNVVITFDRVGSEMDEEDVDIFESMTNEYLENNIGVSDVIQEIQFDHVSVTKQSLSVATRRALTSIQYPAVYDLSVTINAVAFVRHDAKAGSFDLKEMLDEFFSDQSHVVSLKFLLAEKVNFIKLATGEISEIETKEDSTSDSKSGSSVGSVLGSLFGVSIVLGVFWLLWRRCQHSGQHVKQSLSVCSTDSQEFEEGQETYTPYKPNRKETQPIDDSVEAGDVKPSLLSTKSNIEVPNTPMNFGTTPSNMVGGVFAMDTPSSPFTFFQNSSSRNFFKSPGNSARNFFLSPGTSAAGVLASMQSPFNWGESPAAKETIDGNIQTKNELVAPSTIGARFPFRRHGSGYISPASSAEDDENV